MLTLVVARLDRKVICGNWIRADGRNETEPIKFRDLKFNKTIPPLEPTALGAACFPGPRPGHLTDRAPRRNHRTRGNAASPVMPSGRSMFSTTEMERSPSCASSAYFSQAASASSDLTWDDHSMASSNTSWMTMTNNLNFLTRFITTQPLILDGSN